jgi:hypothetical protein
MSIRKYRRYWALYDYAGELVCVCLYIQKRHHDALTP